MANDNLGTPERGIEGCKPLDDAKEGGVLGLGVRKEVTVKIYQLNSDGAVIERFNKLRIPVR